MIYITLDTCAWKELLKINIYEQDNPFDEICFWIENKELTLITPENIIREWNRQKDIRSTEIINHHKALQNSLIKPLIGNNSTIADSISKNNEVEKIIQSRLDRLEMIFKIHTKTAEESKNILLEAANLNLNCIPPNHIKDSYRDSVNLLTLVAYLKANHITGAIFTTHNHKDYSESDQNREVLNGVIESITKEVNLKYYYFRTENQAGRLFNFLRENLSSYKDHLKKKIEKENKIRVEENAMTTLPNLENTDVDFLENIKHIDAIIRKSSPTKFDELVLQLLIESHPSYKQYFLKNIGKDGVV